VSSRFSLDGQIAVVTGSCGKLGPIWVEALLEAGARVAALDLPGATPSPAFAAVAERFNGVPRFDIDITSRASIEAAARAVQDAMGVPGVLVNNAGIDQAPDSPGGRHHLDTLPIEEFRRMVEVNLLGTFQVTQVFGGLMAQHGGGSIINIGSLYASLSPDPALYDHIPADPPFIKPAAYGASKAALVNLTRYLAVHWAASGVRVNALSPGGVLANQDAEFRRKFCAKVPMRRMAEEADLEGPLLFLASGASRYVTGVELHVDGGFTAI